MRVNFIIPISRGGEISKGSTTTRAITLKQRMEASSNVGLLTRKVIPTQGDLRTRS